MKTHQIIICGTGLAGLRVAAHLREQDFSGRITVLADERTPPYDRPPLSKEIFGDYRSPLAAQGLGELSELADEIIVDPVISFIPGGVQTRESSYLADAVVAALGAAPRRTREDSYVLRTRRDAELIRQIEGPVEILGAGWIGCELAASFALAGREVTLTEASGRPLPALGAAADPIARYLDSLGIKRAESYAPVTDLPLIEATGVIATTLGADLRTDLWGRTGEPGRYAVGDCATILGGPAAGHWNTALAQAERVARAIIADLGGEELPPPEPLITDVFSTIGELELLLIGSPTGQLIAAGEDGRFRALWLSDGALAGGLTINRPADGVALRKNLGTALSPDVAAEDAPLKKLLRRR